MIHVGVLVLEGMPGAGKTSLGRLLGARGHPVIGEYLTAEGLPPSPGDDRAHQRNWERKEQLIAAAGGGVVVDRNFVTSLAYAYTLRGEQPHLLDQRVRWCRQRIRQGRFKHPAVYCLLDCTAEQSLRRRGIHRPGAHPWTRPDVLARLRAFYTTLPQALADLDRTLSLPHSARVVRLPCDRPPAGQVVHVEGLLAETAS